MIRVYIIESERGWGQKVEDVKEFDTMDEAIRFCVDFNKTNTPSDIAPDWYMYARIENEIGMRR